MKNIRKMEIIGLNIEITNAKNPSLIGLKGKIIDETKNTITIETKDKEKKLFKNQITFKTNGKEIKGETFKGRPEERIK